VANLDAYLAAENEAIAMELQLRAAEATERALRRAAERVAAAQHNAAVS
jgi:hypothetical protein